MFSAADDVDKVEPAAAPTNDAQIDAKQIHANVQPEASDIAPEIAIDTEPTNHDNSETEPSNHNDIDGTQAHANVQLEELPDSATIASYLCPCQCDDDHESYELKPPAITYADWIAPDMGSVYGNGYISADRFPRRVLSSSHDASPAGLQRGGDHGRHKYL